MFCGAGVPDGKTTESGTRRIASGTSLKFVNLELETELFVHLLQPS